MEYYSVSRKNDILPFAATWMDLEIIMLSEVSHTKTNTALYHLYVESKKKSVNIYAKEKQTHRYKKQTSGYQVGEGWGEEHVRGRGLRDTNYYV